MDINVLISTLTEGLDEQTAAAVRKAIERDAVKSKAAGWKQESEYQQLITNQNALQQELEGDAAQGKLGAKAYREWYEKNYSAVQDLQQRAAKYKEKYGDLDSPNPNPNPNPGFGFRSQEEFDTAVQNRLDKLWTERQAPQVSDVVLKTGRLVQRHMFAGRKTEIDFDKVSQLARDKYAGNLELAYNEWDQPERDRITKEDTEKEVTRRVEEELQKRGAPANFPRASDFTPGSLTAKTKEATDKFDRTALLQDMAKDWNTQAA